jgi:hypothetical protein
VAFTKVFENPVTAVAVRITMFESLFACDDNYHRVLRRRYDPSLLLAAKACVNVDPSIVNAANLKSPCHFADSLFCAIVRLGHSVFAPPAAIAASASPRSRASNFDIVGKSNARKKISEGMG